MVLQIIASFSPEYALLAFKKPIFFMKLVVTVKIPWIRKRFSTGAARNAGTHPYNRPHSRSANASMTQIVCVQPYIQEWIHIQS